MATLNKNNSAVKRIMQEARELANDPSTDYAAGPLEDDIFEWHCTLRGPAGTEFEGGLYHFRILLPAEYPFRPPSIMILTPNGRFELNTKICISFTNYHEELWQPAWGVRTAIIGLQGFFPLKGQAAVGVGSIEYPAAERKRLATLSRDWICPHCKQTNLEHLPDPPAPIPTGQTLGQALTERLGPSSEDAPEVENESDQTTASQHSLTDAQRSEVQAMASALHDRLNSLRNRTEEAVDMTPKEPSRQSPDITRVDTPSTPASISSFQEVRAPVRSSEKPPVLLDTAICFLLVLLFAIICRRMV